MATGFTVGTTDLDSIFKLKHIHTAARGDLAYYSDYIGVGGTVSSRYQPSLETKDQIGWHTGFGHDVTDFRYIFQAINYYAIEADLSSTQETTSNYAWNDNGVIHYTVYTKYLQPDSYGNYSFTVTLEGIRQDVYYVNGWITYQYGNFAGRNAQNYGITIRCSISGVAVYREIHVTYGGGNQSVTIR